MEPQELLKGEIIGRHVVLIDCKNKSLKGKQGIIVDETKNMIVIENEKGERISAAKDQCFFNFRHGDEKIKIKGALLCGRPEDRIKSKVKNERN